MANIHKSFATGDIGEKILLNYLKSIQLSCGKNIDDKKADYDIWCEFDGFRWTFEVKNDVMSLRTDNLALEFFNSKSNKESGITITKADFWVYTFGHEMEGIWVGKVERIRDYIQTRKPKKIMYSVGDGNADIMLFDKQAFLKDLFIDVSKLNQLMFKRNLYEL